MPVRESSLSTTGDSVMRKAFIIVWLMRIREVVNEILY